jgi:hypothetical protein
MSDAKKLRDSLTPVLDDPREQQHLPAACTRISLVEAAGKRSPVEMCHTRLSDTEHAVGVRMLGNVPNDNHEGNHAAIAERNYLPDEQLWITVDSGHPDLLIQDSGEALITEQADDFNVGLVQWIPPTLRVQVTDWMIDTWNAMDRAESGQEVTSCRHRLFEVHTPQAIITGDTVWLEPLAEVVKSDGGLAFPVTLWMQGLTVEWKDEAGQDGAESGSDGATSIGPNDSISHAGNRTLGLLNS